MNEDILKLKKQLVVNRILIILELLILLVFLGGVVYGGLTAVSYINELTPTIEALKKIDTDQISNAVNTLSQIDPSELEEMGKSLDSINANLETAMVEVETLNTNMETISQYMDALGSLFRR